MSDLLGREMTTFQRVCTEERLLLYHHQVLNLNLRIPVLLEMPAYTGLREEISTLMVKLGRDSVSETVVRLQLLKGPVIIAVNI